MSGRSCRRSAVRIRHTQHEMASSTVMRSSNGAPARCLGSRASANQGVSRVAHAPALVRSIGAARRARTVAVRATEEEVISEQDQTKLDELVNRWRVGVRAAAAAASSRAHQRRAHSRSSCHALRCRRCSTSTGEAETYLLNLSPRIRAIVAATPAGTLRRAGRAAPAAPPARCGAAARAPVACSAPACRDRVASRAQGRLHRPRGAQAAAGEHRERHRRALHAGGDQRVRLWACSAALRAEVLSV